MRLGVVLCVLVLMALAVSVSIAQDIPVTNITVVQAIEDITLDMENARIFNTDNLSCEVDASYSGKDELLSSSYIQFDISDLQISDNDVCVLLLKATSVEKRASDESAEIILSFMSSEWTEDSSFTDLANAFYATGLSSDAMLQAATYDTGSIFAFDVSNRVKEVSSADDYISFILMASGNTDYRVDFKSRETGEGPCLLIMPYPLPITTVEG